MFNRKSLLTFSAAALALTGVLVAALPDADARERRGKATVNTPRGTVTGEATTTRQPGQRTREAVVTGPNGQTATNSDVRTRDRAAGTYSRDNVRTGPNGATRTLETDAQRTGPGTYETTRTVTGPGGNARTQTGEFNRQRTDTGRTTTGTIQTQNQGTVDYNRSVSTQDGVRTATGTATFEDGTSIIRNATGSCDPATSTCAGTRSVTNRAGQTTSTAASRQRTETGAVINRDTTFPDGTTRTVDQTNTRNGDGTGTFTRSITGRNGETRTQTGEVSVTPGQ